MFSVIWLLGAVLFWASAGFVLYKIAESEDDFLVKHAILGILIIFVVGLIPILNLIGLILVVGCVIMHIVEDDDTDDWWNRRAVDNKKAK